MVTKKTAGPKKSAGKLKLKKETIRDLDLRKTSGQINGGKKNQGIFPTCVGANCITATVSG
jgi:hypothetical protein